MHPTRQREFAVEVLLRLRREGYEAYWAGGCVRDLLLGLTPKDFDVATNATPPVIRRIFGHKKTLAIGEAFGVIAVIGPRGAGLVEVATFRSDLGYSDGRRPDAVAFGTAKEDVQRRDFTINGMLYDPVDEQVLDYVGGRDDLQRGVIRAIGDPRLRFDEDKLRTLRAVRFAARFGFEMEPATREAVRAMASQIRVVAAERVAQEMRAMLLHESRDYGMRLCREVGVLAEILPESLPLAELPGPPGDPHGNLWEHTLDCLRRLREPSFALALAVLLHGLGERQACPANRAAEISRQVCQRWRLSNADERRVCWLVENQRLLDDAVNMPWSRLQPVLIRDGVDELLALHEAEAASVGRDTAHVEYCRRKLQLPPETLNPPPLLNGNDLIAHGVRQGRRFQTLLAAVRDAQLDGQVQDKQQALALVDRLLAEEG